MNIINLRRTCAGGSVVALFDLAMTPDIVLTDWQLRQTRKGLRAFPPNTSNGRPAVLINPRDFSIIGRLAVTEYTGGDAHNDQPNI